MPFTDIVGVVVNFFQFIRESNNIDVRVSRQSQWHDDWSLWQFNKVLIACVNLKVKIM